MVDDGRLLNDCHCFPSLSEKYKSQSLFNIILRLYANAVCKLVMKKPLTNKLSINIEIYDHYHFKPNRWVFLDFPPTSSYKTIEEQF